MRIVACLIAGILASLAITARSEPVRAAPPSYGVEPQPDCIPKASSSCSAASCHGGGPAGRPGSEHTSWAPEVFSDGAHDPHSNAYRVLFKAESDRMAQAVGNGKIVAHKLDLCLKCHAPAGITDPEVRAEGVGCSACHGSSEKWRTVHYLPDWKAKSNRDKSASGFIPTKNLVDRISNCASCHVGSADREVNHDLIAAGHPRLAFEYTRFHYQGSYRKHWEERIPQPDFEVRAWAIGQVASLRAAVEVLRSRAVKAKSNAAPWPEFSEGSCYSCHQNVVRDPFPKPSAEKLRGLQGERSRSAGTIPWQPWYASLGGSVADFDAILFRIEPGHESRELMALRGELQKHLTALQTEMQKRYPNPATVADLAGGVIPNLDRWLIKWQDAEDENSFPEMSPETSKALGHLLSHGAVTAEGKLKDYDWDFAAQRYLGLAALYHANRGLAPVAPWRPPLERLRLALAFPTSDHYASPRDYRPERTVAPFLELRTITTPRSGR